MRLALIPFLVLAMLAVPLAAAETFSAVDPKALPLINIFDPRTRENEQLIRYSYEELDLLMGNPRFQRWNDMPRVCASMRIMFGRESPWCTGVPERSILPVRRSVTTATVAFEILPPAYEHDPRIIVIVDPIHPPWMPR